MTTLQVKVTVPKDILFNQVANEMVLLNLATGKYFSLDDVGTRMWNRIIEHDGDLGRAHQALLREYQVEARQLEQDLIELADKLIGGGLLQVAEA
ncbi:MAG: hypothetical protein HFACDABA_02342 [Anaerolineales bacterium]|nr:hypothetical protein [Anaerolineales bacterium]